VPYLFLKERAAYGPPGKIFKARVAQAIGIDVSQISDYLENMTTLPGHHFPGWKVSFGVPCDLTFPQLQALSKLLRTNTIDISDAESGITWDELMAVRLAVRLAEKKLEDDDPIVLCGDGTGNLTVVAHNARRG